MVATHIDKRHIHNHIIWNSTALDCTRKFRNFWGSTKAVRQLSDLLCTEHQLSVIEDPKPFSATYNRWLGNEARPSNRARLRAAIEHALTLNPATMDELLTLLMDEGYQIKRGKHISVMSPGAKRSIRLDSLGEGFGQQELQSLLSKQRRGIAKISSDVVRQQKTLGLLIDIQEKMRAGKGLGYERWAKVFNLKQMAQTVNFITENNLSDYKKLDAQATQSVAVFNQLSQQIQATEKRMRELSTMKTHLLNYLKTRDTYVAYRKAGYSKRFLAEHESDIALHKAAKAAFDSQGSKKLPTLKEIQVEYEKSLQQKRSIYPQFTHARQEMKAILTAKANVDRLLGYEEKSAKKARDHR